MKTKGLLIALVVLMCSQLAQAIEVEIDGLWYEVVSRVKEAKVIHYKSNFPYSGDIVIPATVEYEGVEYSVTSIGEAAFSYCSSLTSVTIGNNVTSIGKNAFNECRNLTSVHIMDLAAWCKISYSDTDYYESNPLYYAHHLYQNNQEITDLIIPEGVTSIGSGAFNYCSSLTSVTIPNSVTSIGNKAFSKCSGLTSVTIGNSVTSIGWGAFQSCSNLTSVTIGDGVTAIGKNAFHGCSGLTSVTIGNSVTSIGSYAFSECSSLTSLTIPNSVMSIEIGTFSGCSALTSVTIGNSVTSIGWGAFQDCSSLTSVTIPSGVTSIGGEAFSGCSRLTSVTIPNSVKSIDNVAFYECSRLTSVTIPNSVTSIGISAFCYCYSLTSVTIGNSLTSIGNDAFLGCSKLTSVHIIDPATWCKIYFSTSFSNPLYYASHLYQNNQEITDIIIPEGVTSIGKYTFFNCSGLTSVTIPNSVTSIGEMTFQGCSGLTSITIPNNVTTIGKSAFNGCSGLTSVTIGSGIKTISAYAFAKCSEVADVYCYAENVPQTESNTFADSYINHSTLHVPAGTIDKYKATTVWNDFANIVEMEAPHYSYNLTYIVDGQEYKTYSIDSQTTITPEAEPEKEGYTFSGWSEIPETMPAHDVIITGSFTINSYKLTYVVDGEENSVETVEYGTTITKKEQPTKEGYTFSGWSEVPETMPAHDVTITGSFTINSYKLTYVIDGETYKEIELEYGAEVTPEADLEKEGFTFSGWSEIPTTMPAHDVVVTGSFTRGAYKLIYIVDGEIYKTYSKDYQDAITAEATPEREGYTFSGWSEIPETMPAHDVTVTGTFTINHYTLTLKVGENVYETQTLDYGSAITLPEMPELTGYTFTWGEAPETMPAQNLTIIGTYNSNYYNVTYLIDGQFYSIVKVQFGSTITPPEVPEREGSTFAWIDVPATMPAHDIVIEGSYTDALKDVMQEGYKGEIYTLDGKKVNRMQRGVNIIRRGSRTIKVRR